MRKEKNPILKVAQQIHVYRNLLGLFSEGPVSLASLLRFFLARRSSISAAREFSSRLRVFWRFCARSPSSCTCVDRRPSQSPQFWRLWLSMNVVQLCTASPDITGGLYSRTELEDPKTTPPPARGCISLSKFFCGIFIPNLFELRLFGFCALSCVHHI